MGEILTQQAIAVLVDTALPRAESVAVCSITVVNVVIFGKAPVMIRYLALVPLIQLGVVTAASIFVLLSVREEISCAFGSLDLRSNGPV